MQTHASFVVTAERLSLFKYSMYMCMQAAGKESGFSLAADEQVVQRIEALEQDFLQHEQQIKTQLESMQASRANLSHVD